MLKHFKEKVNVKSLTLKFNKDSKEHSAMNFINNNFLIPDYYNIDEEQKKLYYLGIHELINNSIRASKEKNINIPISLEIKYEMDKIIIKIIDYAGGFDVEGTCFGKHLQSAGKEHCEYIEKTHRGGMGLKMASKIFDSFKIIFLDRNKKPSNFIEGQIEKTIIKLTINLIRRK